MKEEEVGGWWGRVEVGGIEIGEEVKDEVLVIVGEGGFE